MLCCYSRWFSGSGLPLVFSFSKGKIVRNCTHRESNGILIVFQVQLRVTKRGSESFLSDLLQPLLDQVILVFSNDKRSIPCLKVRLCGIQYKWSEIVSFYSVQFYSIQISAASKLKRKTTIRDGSSTALYAAYTVDPVVTVDTVNTVDMFFWILSKLPHPLPQI